MNTLLVQTKQKSLCFEWTLYQEAVTMLNDNKVPFSTIDLFDDEFDPVDRTTESEKNIKLIDRYRSLVDSSGSIVFISPIAWGSLGAMSEGFLSKVFVETWAYQFNTDMLKVIPMLEKKILFIAVEMLNSPLNTFTDDVILRSRIKRCFIQKCFTKRGSIHQILMTNNSNDNKILLEKSLEKIRRII